MTEQIIYLSHLRKEQALAELIQAALEREFSHRAIVFRSAHLAEAPEGSNVLRKMEDALTHCVASLHLLSPNSVHQSLTKFEMGALWARQLAARHSGASRFVMLPLFHSGLTAAGLPSPLNNIQGAAANEAAHLESVFVKVRDALGESRPLETDFDALATQVIAFERRNAFGSRTDEMLTLFGL